MPRSRENAYQVRDALVMPAITQKIWPIVQMKITPFAAALLSAPSMIGIEPPPPPVTAFSLCTANKSASRTSQPAMAEKNTERHTPCDAAIAAPRVSSAVCAEASYPVCVYIVSRKPTGITRNQNAKLPVDPPPKPRLLI